MSDILPPTTSRDLDATQNSPCCDSMLELTSPPNRYECRTCMRVYDLSKSTRAAESDDSESSEGDSTSEPSEATEGASDGDDEPQTIDEAIENGKCPWCDDYTGEHVGQHASSAHPDAWTDYREAEE